MAALPVLIIDANDKKEEMTAQKPLPVWEAESWLQLAMLPHVAPRTDAHVSALSGLDAGGVACTGLRRAQACICCEAGKENIFQKGFSGHVFSRLLLSCFCAYFLPLPPFPHSRSCSHHSILSPRTKLWTRHAQESSSSRRRMRCKSSRGGQHEKHEQVLFDGTQQLVFLKKKNWCRSM